MIRPLLHCILFAVGMGATVCVIRGLDEVPFWSWTRPKIVHLAAHAGEFDTVFVGSSRTHGGVVPQLFDRRMAELGTPTRSFNLGVAGLRPDDFGPIIDWVATGNAGPIRRAVVEVHAFDPSLREGNWMSDVEVEMHTPGWLGSRLGSVACTQASLFEKATMVGSAFAHASVNTLRVGQGARILDDLFAGTSKLAGGGGLASGQGYVEVYERTKYLPVRRKQHEEWRADPASAAKMLDTKRKDLTPTWLAGEFHIQGLVAQAQVLRAAGIEPIFVVFPTWSMALRGREDLADVPPSIVIVDLDRPLEFPDLYRFDEWFDTDHTLHAGSERITAVLAEKLAAASAAWRDGGVGAGRR